MLTRKNLSMEREVFAKNAHSIGGVLIMDREARNVELRLQASKA